MAKLSMAGLLVVTILGFANLHLAMANGTEGEDICENQNRDTPAKCTQLSCCEWDDGQCWWAGSDCGDTGGGNEDNECLGLKKRKCKRNSGCVWDNRERECLSEDEAGDCIGLKAKKCKRARPKCVWDKKSRACLDNDGDNGDKDECAGLKRRQCKKNSSCAWDRAARECASADDDENDGECLDQYAARLGVSALPSSASAQYKKYFCQYTYLQAPNGKRVEIFGGSNLMSLQLYRAARLLEWYLTDLPGSEYGASKAAVFNQMADNEAKLDMPNGAHNQPGAGVSLDGQELYEEETPVEGSKWYMENDPNHRDAALEEILHLVHDTGIGIDGKNSQDGVLPEYQKEIRTASENAMPSWWKPPGKGIWAEDKSQTHQWLKELKRENSLTQEYLAAVIDTAYGLWGHSDEDLGMGGLYAAKTPAQIATADPMGAELIPKFFQPYYTWMVMLDPSLEGTFSLEFDASQKYTWKSQFITHATLLGNRDSNLKGNARDNRLGPNSGTNILDGASGTDTAVFQGMCSEYSVSINPGDMSVVTDSVPDRDSVTFLINIEKLSFTGDGGGDPCDYSAALQ